jgi:hypothetical protein
MNEAKKEFQWVSITDEKKIREAVWELKEAGIGDRNELVFRDLFF